MPEPLTSAELEEAARAINYPPFTSNVVLAEKLRTAASVARVRERKAA